MEKYLFGANINEIQSLIFETGKLKEIIGGSVFIEQACTTEFVKAVETTGFPFKVENQVINAAGKIQYIFDSREVCEKVVFDYFKKLSVKMPGIKYVQAVQKFEGELKKEDISALERKLNIQRSKTINQHQLGLMISERARKTGGIGFFEDEKENYEVLDQRQHTKRQYNWRNKRGLFHHFLSNQNDYSDSYFPQEIDDIRFKKDNEWIAIVHADGNNLGKLISSLSQKVQGKNYQSFLSEFSSNLDKATKEAAKAAFQKVIHPAFEKLEGKKFIPLTPVLLGGDDLTIIIRADLAIDFTHEFLKNLEFQTSSHFEELAKELGASNLSNGLTACAGIAYIKYNYPFHFGVNLANDLCKYAKKRAKRLIQEGGRVPSCLAFHKVQSSYVGDFEKEILERELKVLNSADSIQFNFGPYFLTRQPGYSTVSDLKKWVKIIQKKNAPKSGLREWLAELGVNYPKAEQLMNRICRLNVDNASKLELDRYIRERLVPASRFEEEQKEKVTHIYDILSIAGIENS